MPKTFYTERDIVDLINQGVKSLIVDDDVVLTDLAYEKARRLGLELLRESDQPPGAPVRPYIAKSRSSPARNSGRTSPMPPPSSASPGPVQGSAQNDDLQQRVFKAAHARLGNSVDPKLLETIIQRVIKSISTR